MTMHYFAPPSDWFGRLALGGFSFYYKRKNAAMDDYLKGQAEAIMILPSSHRSSKYILPQPMRAALCESQRGAIPMRSNA